jgi:hypothetical protein
MLERIDTDIRRNRAELADFSIDGFGMALYIGKIAHGDIAHNHALSHFGIFAKLDAL